MTVPDGSDVMSEAIRLHQKNKMLRAELTRVSDLVVDVLHGRKHSGELLSAIAPYRSDITVREDRP